MKSIKALLLILLDQYQNNRIDGIQWSGLCHAVFMLRDHRLIDLYDRKALIDVIEANRPELDKSGKYWWPKGEVEPRVEFLKQLIKKYEQ